MFIHQVIDCATYMYHSLDITVQTPVSRLLKTGAGINTSGHAFQMPASSIRARNPADSMAARQRLLDSFNRGTVYLSEVLRQFHSVL